MGRPPAVRFRPPPLAIDAALRWMLQRAFGPLAPTTADGVMADAAAALAAVNAARRFDLATRIAARHGRARLAAELGADAAGDLMHDRSRAVGVGLRLTALAERVAELAARHGLPIVFLKFAALELGGHLMAGSRTACDVDVLAPAGRAAELQAALVAAGFAPSSLPSPEHQLPALAGDLGVVEVHKVLLGVRLNGGGSTAGRSSATGSNAGRSASGSDVRRSASGSDVRRSASGSDVGRSAFVSGVGRSASGSASAADLDAAGLLLPLAGWPGETFVPAPAVAAAHALVHGLAQHGWAPASYPIFRMVSDLIDLGWGGAGGAALAAATAPWVAAEVSAGEVAAVQRLTAALAAGEGIAAWGHGGGDARAGEDDATAGAALLLRHALAGQLDAVYARALRLSLFRRQPSDDGEPARLGRLLARTVWLSRSQVDAIYGPPRRPLGYLGRRLGRPFDLLARLGRSTLAAWRLRHGRSE